MRPEVKELWLAALRSGEYKQTQGFLEVTEPNDDTPVGMCCLGVLCDVAMKNGVKLKKDAHGQMGSSLIYSGFDGLNGTLPEAVMKWAGLEEPDPMIDPDVDTTAASANDGGSTFEEIALLIEANL